MDLIEQTILIKLYDKWKEYIATLKESEVLDAVEDTFLSNKQYFKNLVKLKRKELQLIFDQYEQIKKIQFELQK